MLITKRPLIALFASSISLLALVNCGDDGDSVPGDDAGSSGEAGSKAGSSGKSGGSNVAGETGEAGQPSGGTSGGSGGPSGGTSGNSPSDAGEGGLPSVGEGGEGGEAGSGGPVGPHLGPILRYAFDEASGLLAADSSGRGLNATLSLAAWTNEGRNGAGLSLNGGLNPTKYVTVPPGVLTDVKETTIGAWVKLGVDGAWSRIFDFGGTGVDAAARFMYLTPSAADGIHFSVFGGSPQREAIVATNTHLPLGVWKHVAVTAAANGKHAIYVDGFPAAETTTFAIPPSELEPLSASSWIGKSRFPLDLGLNGTLDDFVVYDRVLSPAEISTLAYPKADYSRLPFDEAAGVVSNDISSRAVNATLTGTSWASGRSGAAVALSGENQFVTLSNPIAGCTTELTIAMWVKNAGTGAWSRIFDFGGTDDNFMFLANNPEGKLAFNIHHKLIDTNTVTAVGVPADSNWHHVAVVVNALTGTVYVDGAASGLPIVLPITPVGLGATNEHWLGKSRFPDPYFKGAFDELRIACRAYSADEIKNLAFK